MVERRHKDYACLRVLECPFYVPYMSFSYPYHVLTMSLPSLLSSPMFLHISRVFFALLLLASAVGKLLDMPGFYGIVRSYQLLSDARIAPAAWALSLTELAVGAALGMTSAGLKLRPAVVGLLVLLHVFYLFGLTTALARGLALPNCGCFGVYWPRPLSAWSVLEDVVLLLWATAFYWGLAASQARSNRQHAQGQR